MPTKKEGNMDSENRTK